MSELRKKNRWYWPVLLAFFALALCGPAADADDLERIGRSTAIVFSPDFADPENRQLYERLGFLYLETPDWREVLEQLRIHNESPENEPVRTLIVESHGTNGSGLKLQEDKTPDGYRSYISVGALQEHLDTMGVEVAILSACNAGRLLRPEIYHALDRTVDDPLFLPATLGVIDASPDFDATRTEVKVLRRAESNLETLLHASTAELDPDLRLALHPNDEEWRFAVSTMLIQIVTGDPSLELVEGGFVRGKSRADIGPHESEMLFQAFGRLLESKSQAGGAPEVVAASR